MSVLDKPVARLIVRGVDPSDGLFIGTTLRSAQGIFEENTVYELRACRINPGDFRLVKIGTGTPANTGKGEKYTDSPVGVTWGSEIGTVLAGAGKYLFLSREEVEAIRREEAEKEAK